MTLLSENDTIDIQCNTQANIESLTHYLCHWANIPVPKLVYDLRGHTAGEYWPNEHKIRFNMDVAENYPNLYHVTVIHELAHAVDYIRNGYRKYSNGKHIHHDDTFYAYCSMLHSYTDYIPHEYKRTHEYKTTATRKFREFEYKCGCPEPHMVKTPTHNKIQRGYQYICRECKTTFGKTHFLKEKR